MEELGNADAKKAICHDFFYRVTVSDFPLISPPFFSRKEILDKDNALEELCALGIFFPLFLLCQESDFIWFQ